MSILAGAEFVVAFYEELPAYLAKKKENKEHQKEYKKLRSFLQKTRRSLEKIQDDTSRHASIEQKRFIDAMVGLASEYLEYGHETEASKKHKKAIEYALYVWSILSPLPKKIKQMSLTEEQANESHFYSIESLTNLLYTHEKISDFYHAIFALPFEKIKKASDGFRKQYLHLASAGTQEGMVYASSMAERMKKMYHDYTVIYEFARLTNDTSKYAYVMLMNTMPPIVIEALERPITPKEEKELRDYVNWLEKQVKKQDWSKYLRFDVPVEQLIAEERENDELFDVPTPLDVVEVVPQTAEGTSEAEETTLVGTTLETVQTPTLEETSVETATEDVTTTEEVVEQTVTLEIAEEIPTQESVEEPTTAETTESTTLPETSEEPTLEPMTQLPLTSSEETTEEVDSEVELVTEEQSEPLSQEE